MMWNQLKALRFGLTVVLAAGFVFQLYGCAGTPDWQRAEAQEIDTADPAGLEALSPQREARRWSGGVTAVAAARRGLPRAGAVLPRVSPDGEWVAFLDLGEQQSAASPDRWVNGRGLAGVSLWLRGVEAEGLARHVALGQVAWPTWSRDGEALWFVSYAPETGCALAWHDVATGQTRRLAVGLSHMLTPAVAPGGRRVAVSAYGELPDEALLFVVDRNSGQVTPGPPPTLGGAQLLPTWLDADTLLFVELDQHGGGLMRWTVGSAQAEPVAPLDLPASIFDAVHLHAGIAQPVSPSGRWFAYYSATRDRIALIDLRGGGALVLEVGDRAGAWWGDDWFVAGNDDRLSLIALPQEPAEVYDDPARMNLLTGRWVPRWTDPAARTMLLIGEGDDPGRFGLLQLWVVTR